MKKIIPARSKEVFYKRETNGGVFILELNNESFFYKVDKVAAALWLLIDGKKDLDFLVDELQKKQKVPRPALKKYTMDFLKKLKKEKLATY